MELANKNQCTGCGACQQACPLSCISMIPDEAGFLCPEVDTDRCIGCGKCAKACPVLKKTSRPWTPEAFAAYVQADTIREESSSGGIFSALALQILDAGGVVFGAAFEEDFSVNHIRVDTPGALWRLRGAKYVQSNIGSVFSEAKTCLEEGRTVLFSGTPCQIAGLQAFLDKAYPNLLCVDIVCMGVPSPTAWRSYLHYRSHSDACGVLPERVSFRSKDSGWSVYRYSVTMQYPNGITYRVPNQQDLYMRLFVGHQLSRLSCENCVFKTEHRRSDITLGDFWGIWEYAPEMDDDRGTSLVLTHSEKGRQAIASLEQSTRIKSMPLYSADARNPAVSQSFSLAPGRKRILQLACEGNYEKIEDLLRKDDRRFRLKQLAGKMKRKLRRLVPKRK